MACGSQINNKSLSTVACFFKFSFLVFFPISDIKALMYFKLDNKENRKDYLQQDKKLILNELQDHKRWERRFTSANESLHWRHKEIQLLWQPWPRGARSILGISSLECPDSLSKCRSKVPEVISRLPLLCLYKHSPLTPSWEWQYVRTCGNNWGKSTTSEFKRRIGCGLEGKLSDHYLNDRVFNVSCSFGVYC